MTIFAGTIRRAPSGESTPDVSPAPSPTRRASGLLSTRWLRALKDLVNPEGEKSRRRRGLGVPDMPGVRHTISSCFTKSVHASEGER